MASDARPITANGSPHGKRVALEISNTPVTPNKEAAK